jgi:hypothetical protein
MGTRADTWGLPGRNANLPARHDLAAPHQVNARIHTVEYSFQNKSSLRRVAGFLAR